MNTTPDFTKMMQDMMASMPMDTQAFQNAFRNQAAMSEKFSRVALEAAQKSTEISARWANEAIAKMTEASRAKTDPADYGRAASELAQAATEMATQHMAAFAEVAKKVQMETVELMLSAGKEASTEASATMQKAAVDMTGMARKAGGAPV